MHRMGGGKYIKGIPRFKFSGAVKNALALNRKPWICEGCGLAYQTKEEAQGTWRTAKCREGAIVHRRRIFTNSLSDWLDAEVPIEWLDEMLDTIRQCDQVTWILCTKRPENFFNRLMEIEECGDNGDGTQGILAHWLHSWMVGHEIPENIILLASVENQAMADKRIPELLKIPAVCHGLSLEPLLEDVNCELWLNAPKNHRLVGTPELPAFSKIDWQIIGGESGPAARPCNIEWIRSLIEQGKAAGLPTFVKQLGAAPYQSPKHDGATGYQLSLKDKKGGDISEWPEDLRIQQWPNL